MDEADARQMIQSSENATRNVSGLPDDRSEQAMSSLLNSECAQAPIVVHTGELVQKALRAPNLKYQLTTLPTEILSQIFSRLGPMQLFEKARLCLVSKALLPVAREYLYRDNCFIPIPFASCYAFDKTPPFLRFDSSVKSSTQRSVLYCKALLLGDFGPMNLGNLALDFSEPGSAPAWLDFQLLSIHKFVTHSNYVIKELYCMLPPLWIQIDLLDPFLHNDRAINVNIIAATKDGIPDNPQICLRRVTTPDGRLHGHYSPPPYRRPVFPLDGFAAQSYLLVSGQKKTMNRVLDMYGNRINDISISMTRWRDDLASIPMKCPKLRVLRFRLDEQPGSTIRTNKKAWSNKHVVTLHIYTRLPISPTVLLAASQEFSGHLPYLQTIRLVWRKYGSRGEKDAKAWSEIEAFCRPNSTERLEVVNEMLNRNCTLVTELKRR